MARRRGAGQAWTGAGVVAALVAASLLLPTLTGGDPYTVDLQARLEPPSRAHLLGRDALGRDLLARLCLAARLSLSVAAAAVAIAVVVGVAVGAVAGWRGGWTDALLARMIDVFLAFPGLLLAIALAALLGPSPGHVVVPLAAFGWTGYARLVRAHVATVKHREFVDAARAAGTGAATIVRRHVVPGAWPLVLVQASSARVTHSCASLGRASGVARQ